MKKRKKGKGASKAGLLARQRLVAVEKERRKERGRAARHAFLRHRYNNQQG